MDQAEFLVEVGKRIKVQRLKLNISQQQLAVKCDFEKSNMSRLEAGRTNPTLITLRKICLAMDTKVCILTDGL